MLSFILQCRMKTQILSFLKEVHMSKSKSLDGLFIQSIHVLWWKNLNYVFVVEFDGFASC